MRWDTVKHKWVLNECIFKWEVNDQYKRNILTFLVTEWLGLKQNKYVKEEWMDWEETETSRHGFEEILNPESSDLNIVI